MINLFQPSLGVEELNEIKKVFSSNWLGKGDYVKKFEKDFASSLQNDSSNFFTTTSCTEAIFLAGDIFNFSPEDEIIVPSISFPSIGSSIISRRAKLVLCDVDRESLNVRAVDIEPKITNRTKAVFLTHYGGFSCDMDPILDLCKRHDILIIEDAACAVRSFYRGKACGTIGDMGMWSFDAMKTLSTADGGMIYLKDHDLKREAEEKLYLGLPRKQKSGIDSSTDSGNSWWEFEMNYPGRRAIMNNVTAAMGCIQLEKLDSFLMRRKEIYSTYHEELGKLDWLSVPPCEDLQNISSYYFFWIQTERRNELARYLLNNGVYTTFRYWPLHKLEIFKEFVSGDLPNSDYVSNCTLNLPLHQGLADQDVEKIIRLIVDFNS